MSNPYLDNIFTYHPPTPEQIPKYNEIREAGKQFAELIYNLVPSLQEKNVAIGKIREAIMWANAGIACHIEDTFK